MFSVAALDTD